MHSMTYDLLDGRHAQRDLRATRSNGGLVMVFKKQRIGCSFQTVYGLMEMVSPAVIMPAVFSLKVCTST